MIDKLEKIDTWRTLIETYIDSLDDKNKCDEYLSELVSIFCFEKSMQAKTDNDTEQKELTNDLKKLEKIKITSKNCRQLKDYYCLFAKRGWIKNNDMELNKIELKQCFYNIWICRAIALGNAVHPATHIAKLTHSSSSGSSIFDRSDEKNHKYITTSSLKNKHIDGAYPNATLSKIVKFFMLNNKDSMLSEEINNGNKEPLVKFSEDENELVTWMETLKSNLNPTPKSDFLSKQIYYPVENNYHLLAVIKSSSIAQSIFIKNFEKTTRKNIEKIDSYRVNQRYIEQTYKKLISIAKVSTTFSKPQNASVLNGARGGKLHLFSCEPPTWQKQLKPPIYYESHFYVITLDKNTQTTLDYLRDFLMRYQFIDLSIKDPERRKWIDKWLNEIIDEVLAYAAEIQNLEAGWTEVENIKLKTAHQYFLDPYRDDKTFQSARKANNWQAVVCQDFAHWLNYKLIGKDKKFTPHPFHTRIWIELLEQLLREHNTMIEANMPIREKV